MKRSRIPWLGLAFIALGMLQCTTSGDGAPKWVTDGNAAPGIDWKEVEKAYKESTSPEDFEKRVNEIYPGDEVVSVAIAGEASKHQATGFIDKNKDGQVQDAERIFVIETKVNGEQGQGSVTGHGAYHGQGIGFFEVMMASMMGSMIANALMPGGFGYGQRYVTNPSSFGQIQSNRDTYRQANPSKFAKASGSGGTWGSSGRDWNRGASSSSSSRSGGSSWGGSRRSGGGSFGRRRRGQSNLLPVVQL